MDMNDDKTGRKTQSLAASQRRARGEYPSPMQSAGPGDVTGPQALGRTGAPGSHQGFGAPGGRQGFGAPSGHQSFRRR